MTEADGLKREAGLAQELELELIGDVVSKQLPIMSFDSVLTLRNETASVCKIPDR